MIIAAFLFAIVDPMVGTWEGTSLCQVRPSPCRDEHVIYRVTSAGPRLYRFSMYKLVTGEEQHMGDLELRLDPTSGELRGSNTDRAGQAHPWTFVRHGTHLSGRLNLGRTGELYRLIEVTKR